MPAALQPLKVQRGQPASPGILLPTFEEPQNVVSEDLLRDAFGLNSYEVRLYVALLGSGMKAAEAAQASGVPLSRTYDTLRSLQQKGFVTEVDGAYKSTRPSTALGSRISRYGVEFESEQEDRREAMKKIVTELEPRARTTVGEAEPVMLKGLESISAAFLEVLRSSKEVYLLVRKGFEAREAFVALLRESKGRAGRVRLLLPLNQEVARGEISEATRLGLEIRRAPGILLDMMAGDGGGVIIGVPARGSMESFAAVAIWVRSKAFAESVLETIAAQWKAARRT